MAFGFIWRGCINDKWRVGPVLPQNAPASVGPPNQRRHSVRKKPLHINPKATLKDTQTGWCNGIRCVTERTAINQAIEVGNAVYLVNQSTMPETPGASPRLTRQKCSAASRTSMALDPFDELTDKDRTPSSGAIPDKWVSSADVALSRLSRTRPTRGRQTRPHAVRRALRMSHHPYRRRQPSSPWHPQRAPAP